MNVTLLSPRAMKSKASNPSIRSPASNEMFSDSVKLWEPLFVFYTCNFSEHMFAFQRYTRFLPKWIFESSRSPSKVWVLAQSQSTMLRRITHMTMLSVVTCVMNVSNQTSQAFVRCSCPYSDWLSKFVDRPQNVRPTNSCQVQAFQDYLFVVKKRWGKAARWPWTSCDVHAHGGWAQNRKQWTRREHKHPQWQRDKMPRSWTSFVAEHLGDALRRWTDCNAPSIVEHLGGRPHWSLFVTGVRGIRWSYAWPPPQWMVTYGHMDCSAADSVASTILVDQPSVHHTSSPKLSTLSVKVKLLFPHTCLSLMKVDASSATIPRTNHTSAWLSLARTTNIGLPRMRAIVRLEILGESLVKHRSEQPVPIPRTPPSFFVNAVSPWSMPWKCWRAPLLVRGWSLPRTTARTRQNHPSIPSGARTCIHQVLEMNLVVMTWDSSKRSRCRPPRVFRARMLERARATLWRPPVGVSSATRWECRHCLVPNVLLWDTGGHVWSRPTRPSCSPAWPTCPSLSGIQHRC